MVRRPYGTGATQARLPLPTVLVITLAALSCAGAGAAAATALLSPDAVGCDAVVCKGRAVALGTRTPPVFERWSSAEGVSLFFTPKHWSPRVTSSSELALDFRAGGRLTVETFAASDAHAAFDARLSHLRSRYVGVEEQGPERTILGPAIADTKAVAGAFCGSVLATPQDVGRRVDVVLMTAVQDGIGVHVEAIADGCGRDAYTSSLLQFSDSVVNSIRWPSAGQPDPAPLPAGPLEPAELAELYGLAPLRARGIEGEGQTIAIITWAPIPTSDIEQFEREYGIDGAPVEERGDAPPDEQIPYGLVEANLDIQVVRSVAPKARIIAYHAGPLMRDLVAAIDRVVRDGEADVLSISGGVCDVPTFQSGAEALSPEIREWGERVLARAVDQGITVFVASGDLGAYACQQRERGDHRVTTKWPANSAHVVSVGGTLVLGGQSRRAESGWQDVLSFAGSGGGANTHNGRPDWQRAPGVPVEPGRRLMPDVAASASPDSAFAIVHAGRQVSVGGTSASAPFWAALFSLIEQHVQQTGGREIGFAAPLLYEIARGADGASAFHDVVTGGNRLDSAGPGWDPATGLGTPDAWVLAQAVAARRVP